MMISEKILNFGSADDREVLPDSLIDDLCTLHPDIARKAFDSYAAQHRFNITGFKMAREIQESLNFARKPRSQPLMKANRDENGHLLVDLEDSTGFNQTLFETLGIAQTGDNREELLNLPEAYLGGFHVVLDEIQSHSELSELEGQLEIVPFPAVRLRFEPVDY